MRPARIAAVLAALSFAWAQPALAEKSIALSFDDVPRRAGAFFTPDERTGALIAALERGGVEQAAFFVTTGNLAAPDGKGGEKRIAAYAAAGHVIGNHSVNHRWLSRTPTSEYVAEIAEADRWLRRRQGYRPWYRFPFLDEAGRDTAKRDEVRGALKRLGLRNGYVTIDNYDWYLDQLASEAKRDGRPIDLAALGDLYVETLLKTANFYEAMAQSTLGRSPVHVLLLHETDLAAMFVDELAAALKADGWELATMDEAYRDPIAAAEPDTSFLGEGRIAALAYMKGARPKDLVFERTDESVLKQLFEARVLRPTGGK